MLAVARFAIIRRGITIDAVWEEDIKDSVEASAHYDKRGGHDSNIILENHGNIRRDVEPL